MLMNRLTGTRDLRHRTTTSPSSIHRPRCQGKNPATTNLSTPTARQRPWNAHDIVDMVSHHIEDRDLLVSCHAQRMTNALSPRTRAAIVSYDPTQPNALSIIEFCRSVKVSRSVFYKIRSRAVQEPTAALHPRSRAPKSPARRYGPEVVNELVRIRKHLKAEGWDYGPRSIYYEATIQVPSPAVGFPRCLRSGGCWPAWARSRLHRRSARSLPTSSSPAPRRCRCGSWMSSSTDWLLGPPRRSISCSMMPPDSISAPPPTPATRTVQMPKR